jgi:glyceraldehyde-3-phosphate dehydrogenase/erythrose-4-phosphate dehydrogenase
MAPIKLAVNGAGRIGRLAIRLAFEKPEVFTLVHVSSSGPGDVVL